MAKHHMKGHKGHHFGTRKDGGRTHEKVSGNPDVFKEAEDEHGTEMKKGGRTKHHKRATGGKVLGLMTGGGVRQRLDRPGRKRGGGVGADTSPLSTAHGTSKPSATPHEEDGGESE